MSTFSGDAGRRAFIKTIVLSTGAVFLDWNVRADAAPGTKKQLHATTGALLYKQAHQYLRDGAAVPRGKAKDAADVIVVGAGLSGLAAAWSIRKSGKSVLVVDSEASIGGHVRTESVGNVSAELGVSRCFRIDGGFATMVRDCGLTPVKLPPDGYWIDSATIITDMYSERTIREKTVALGAPVAIRDFRNFFNAIDPRPVFPLIGVDDAAIAQYDMSDGKDILTGHPGAELAEWLDIFSLATTGRTLAKVNPYAFYALYAPQMGPMFDASYYTFDGGMPGLTRAIANKIGEQYIRTSTLAAQVQNVPGGAEVTVISASGAETLRAKSVIVATQKRIAGRLVAGLPGLQAYRMKNVPYAPMVTVELRCASALSTRRSPVIWFRDPDRRIYYLQDSTFTADFQAGALDRKGEYVYTLPITLLDTAMSSLENEEFLVATAQKAIAALSEFMPYVYDLTTELRIFAWGHAVASPEAGMIGQMHPKMYEPFDRVFFAGADNDICNSVEGAVGHGLHAADLAVAAQ